MCVCFSFHNPADEKVIGRNVVTPVCDDVQLSVDEYRTKLYDVSHVLHSFFVIMYEYIFDFDCMIQNSWRYTLSIPPYSVLTPYMHLVKSLQRGHRHI